tara:strand:+ start:9542 stop:11299 length:1758 start_codon:yes stop_codon:yes gene_type:complete
MNPLNRRMFRQPGASRRPTGILASSPQLANTVANRQPVRMANGGIKTGSRDANERKFREELNRGLIPDLFSGTGDLLSKYAKMLPRSGFARPMLDKTVSGILTAVPKAGDILKERRAIQSGVLPGRVPDFELPRVISEEDSPTERLLASEILGGRRDEQFMGEKRDPNLDVDIGLGDQGGVEIRDEILDFEINPDKKDAGDDEDGMPVPTSKPKRKESPEVKVKKLDKLVDAEVMGEKLDKMFVGEVGSILNSDVSEEEKNDSILEVMGEKDPKKKLTMEERVKKNIALYEKYFPEDDADKFDMNDFAISFGLALATGQSPDLITNAANAAKTALGEKAESDKTRKARKDKLRMLGLTKAFDDEKDERQWGRELEKISINQKYDWTKTVFKNKKDLEKFNAKMAFDKTSLYAKLNTQIDIANNNAENAARREEANQAAALIRAKIGALSDAHAAAYIEFEGQDLTKPEVAAAFHKKADEIADSLAKTSSTMQKDYGPKRIEFEIAEAIANRIKAEIAGGNPNPDVDKITRETRNIYSKALQGAQGINSNIPSYDTAPDADTLQILGDAGITQIIVGGKLYPINKN